MTATAVDQPDPTSSGTPGVRSGGPTMRAVVLRSFGDPDVLVVEDVPQCVPGPGEVRVRVAAAFVAFGRDVTTRRGQHPVFRKIVTLPHVLGGEHAGVVDAVGDGVDDALVGRRVAVSAIVHCDVCAACQAARPWDCTGATALGIHRPGSYAQFTVVPRRNVHEIPTDLPFGAAAACAASGPLAWQELDLAAVGAGDWVLVLGASGSVGTSLVSLAKRRGARVAAATRGGRAETQLRSLGADAVVDSGSERLAEAIRDLTGGGVDVVVDNVMEPNLWRRYWPAVARRGRIVTAGQASGHGELLPIDIVSFYNRRATMTGLTVGDPRPVAAFWADLRHAPLPIDGSLVTAYPLAEAAEAHRAVERGGKVGHVVLSVS